MTIPRWALFAITLPALLAGCPTLEGARRAEFERQEAIYAARQAVEGTAACCRSLADLPYEALSSGERVIDRQTPTFDFTTGRSRFLAFRLPIGSRVVVTVTTTTVGGLGAQSQAVFYPSAMVLDAGFTPIETIDHVTKQHVPGMGWVGQLSFNTANTPARYLVLYANAGSIGGNLRQTPETASIPVTSGLVHAEIRVGYHTMLMLYPFNFEGRLRLKVVQ